MTAKRIKAELRRLADEKKAEILRRFFKTGPGQYAQGDIFLGIPVPKIRKLLPLATGLDLTDLLALLRSKVHEDRLLALLALTKKYSAGTLALKKKVYQAYLKHTRHINNWDLVDLSSPNIVGAYLADKNRAILYRLAGSSSLWERRIAILATFYFIRLDRFNDTLKIATALLNDKHDLIHKACGWMLRETGKRDPAVLEKFLRKNYKKMPRTMLRYAIEKFPENKRQAYLKG